MEQKKIQRQELYNLVWSKPITEIASGIGVSDSMIIKVCKKLNVPRPALGHWAKVKAGKRVTIRKLRAKVAGTPEEHYFLTRKPKESSINNNADHPLVCREYKPEYLIQVPNDDENLSQRSKRNLKSFMTGKLSDYSKAIPKFEKDYDLKVTKEMVPRSIRIMDALLKAFKKRDWQVESMGVGNRNEGIQVTVLNEQFYFGIEESAKRVEHVPSKAESKKSYYWYRKWDYISSGKLFLKIGSFSSTFATRSFNDGKRKRVEGQLNHFCIALVELALEKKESARKRELEEQASRRREIRYDTLKRAKKSELRRREEFESEFGRWLKAEKIREYVKTRKAVFDYKSASDVELEEFQCKQEWALNYADLIDPMTVGLPTIAEDFKEDETRGFGIRHC